MDAISAAVTVLAYVQNRNAARNGMDVSAQLNAATGKDRLTRSVVCVPALTTNVFAQFMNSGALATYMIGEDQAGFFGKP